MRKALIDPRAKLVCQIEDVVFPVAPPMVWIDCPDATKAGDGFDGVTFTKPVPQDFNDPDLSNIDKASKVVKAVMLAAAAMSGKTPIEARAAYLVAWNSLP